VLQNGSTGGISFYPYPLDGSSSGSSGGTGITGVTGVTGSTGTTGTSGTGAIGDVTGLEPGQWRLTLPSNPSLSPGENVFLIQAEGYDGSLSTAAVLTIYLVEDGSMGFLVDPPTNISLSRYKDRVEFVVAHTEDVTDPDSSYIVGYNFYAATTVGGGLEGYTLLNTELVTDYKDLTRELIQSVETKDSEAGSEANTTVETVTTVNTYRNIYRYTYNHVRSNGEDDTDYPQREEAQSIFSVVPNSQEIYYVATALAYDPERAIEYETTYTQELTGLPMVLTARIRDLSPRNLSTIQTDLIKEIRRVDTKIDARPGETTRDVHVDPPSWEANRTWLILDFVHRAQSFLTLLQIDDPESTGTSVTVSNSRYKTALKRALSLTDQDVQTLIDEAFEKLAMNSLTERMGATSAIGQVVVGRSKVPNKDLQVPAGTNFRTRTGVTFVSTAAKTMSASSASSYYNSSTGLYELTVPIEAVTPGLAGNVAAKAISVASISGFAVITNRESTNFGQDQESNLSLAERAMLSYSSVDRGTANGYLRTALDTNGVHRARVVEAGNALMMRDWDEVREKHIGGKVDLWIQGTALVEVQETFAHQYAQDLNVRFEAVGEASNLRFRTTSSNVSESAPLFSMLDDPDNGYGFRNSTTGQDFDLTNVQIIDYRTIQLDTSLTQPAVTETDILIGDYKYRSSDPFVPTIQPIHDVSSITSPSSTLTTDNYTLVRTEDPLLSGSSVEASDSIEIVQANGVPTGNQTSVTGEVKVLVNTSKIPLDSVGVDVNTIVVTNASGSITYTNDLGDAATPDYFIEAGTLTTAPTIARNEAGTILDGQSVRVAYTAEENFTVTYSVNNVLQAVDDGVETMRHVTADVLVKQAVENEVTVSATVVLKVNADQADVDIQIRTNLSNLVNKLQIGQDLHQSDIIHAIEEVPEVLYVVVPLTKLHKSDSSLILRDALDNDYTQLVEGVEADVFLLNQQLTFSTSTGGGPTTRHRGVFRDDQPLTLYNLASDFCALENNPGSALIVGADGVEVCDCGLGGLVTGLGVDTANRVIVSLPKGTTPDDHTWSASYIVDGESGAGDVEAFVMEYLTLGDTVLTYTADTDQYGNN
jgi:uncharacterized phage protein gp47/JayE